MTTNRTIPTVDDVLASAAIGGGFHNWALEGGAIRLPEALLRPVLEAAYDPTMPDWPMRSRAMPDPTYRITTSRGVIRLRSDCRRNAILSALELHGPGATLVRVEIEGEWE